MFKKCHNTSALWLLLRLTSPRLLPRLQVIAVCLHCCSSAYIAICVPLAKVQRTSSPLLVPRAGCGETECSAPYLLYSVFIEHGTTCSVLSVQRTVAYWSNFILAAFAGGRSTALPLPVDPQLALWGPFQPQPSSLHLRGSLPQQ